MESWAIDWQKITGPIPEEGIAWVRSRPPAVQALMQRFPPSCLVVATRPLLCPAPGMIGVVRSYMEDGTLTVIQPPDGRLWAQCDPEWLEVVGFHNGMTPEWVVEIVGEEG